MISPFLMLIAMLPDFSFSNVTSFINLYVKKYVATQPSFLLFFISSLKEGKWLERIFVLVVRSRVLLQHLVEECLMFSMERKQKLTSSSKTAFDNPSAYLLFETGG